MNTKRLFDLIPKSNDKPDCIGVTKVFRNWLPDEEYDDGSFSNELSVSVDSDGFVMIEHPEDELIMQLYLGNVDELITLLQDLKKELQ